MNWLHDMTRMGYGGTIVLITVAYQGGVLAADGGEHAFDETDAGTPRRKWPRSRKIQGRHAKVHPKTWELYRKHKVSPMSGCLPMAIQMPVFFGFFTMIRSAIELRGAHFLWIADLVEIGHIVHDSRLTFIPFISTPGRRAVQPAAATAADGRLDVVQSHLQPPSPGMDPSQAKIMRYMPLIVSGVSLQLLIRPGVGIGRSNNMLTMCANESSRK